MQYYSNSTLASSLALEEKLRVLSKQHPQGATVFWEDGQKRRLRKLSISERFFQKVDKNGPIPQHRPELGRCWTWIGHKQQLGYGMFTIRGKWFSAHRVSYNLLIGPIPEGLHSDHLCRNHSCVNPHHIEPVTPKENCHRGIGPSAINAVKTHCERGHELNEKNTYLTKQKKGRDGFRRCCRKCVIIRKRAYRLRLRAKAAKLKSNVDLPTTTLQSESLPPQTVVFVQIPLL